MGYYFFEVRSFLSPRTSIGFHKKLKTTKYWFLKKIIFEEILSHGKSKLTNATYC